MNVAWFLSKRVGAGVVVVLVATVGSWLLVNVLGNPARLMLPISASPSQVRKFSHQMGFDRPMFSRLGSFLGGAVHGDLGTSYWQQRSAMSVVLERVPAEFKLIALSMAVAYVGALIAGIFAAQRAGGKLDHVIVALSMIGVSMPAFWLGEVLIVIFAVKFGWAPVSGTSGRALVLPVLTTAALPLGRLTQVVRSAVLDERGRVHTAALRARGVPPSRIAFLHAARNASAAIVTMGGWEIGRLVAGFTVTIEIVFAWPGLGQLAVEAIEQRDLPLIVADVFVVSITLVVLNIVVDCLRVVLDRRSSL